MAAAPSTRTGPSTGWRAEQQRSPAPGPDVDPYSRWRHEQYNVRQTSRYLISGDEAATNAVVARMLYSLHDVLRDYFTMRGMAWPGDKEALTYWRAREPDLCSAWLATGAEADIARKVAGWEALFPRIYAPLNGFAPDEMDQIQPVARVSPERAISAWQTLTRRAE